MAERDPLFEGLFFPKEESDDELAKSLFTNPNRIDDGVIDPIGAFLEAAADEQLAKSSGGAGWSWTDPIGPAPRIELSAAFLKRSNARLQRFAEKARTFCGAEHQEEAAEMVELAKAALESEHELIIGS